VIFFWQAIRGESGANPRLFIVALLPERMAQIAIIESVKPGYGQSSPLWIGIIAADRGDIANHLAPADRQSEAKFAIFVHFGTRAAGPVLARISTGSKSMGCFRAPPGPKQAKSYIASGRERGGQRWPVQRCRALMKPV
jgi:hypothetical protein